MLLLLCMHGPKCPHKWWQVSLTLTLVGVTLGGAGPRPVIVERLTLLAVGPRGEVLALAHQAVLQVLVTHNFTGTAMTVALAPAPRGQILLCLSAQLYILSTFCTSSFSLTDHARAPKQQSSASVVIYNWWCWNSNITFTSCLKDQHQSNQTTATSLWPAV